MQSNEKRHDEPYKPSTRDPADITRPCDVPFDCQDCKVSDTVLVALTFKFSGLRDPALTIDANFH